MKSILLYLSMVLVPSVALFKLLDVWLIASERRNLRERIAHLWLNAAEKTPLAFVQLPLKMLSGLLDRIYGRKVISFKSFIRVAVSSCAILISTLGLVGIFSGIPFSVQEPPWHSFDETFKFAEEVFTKAEAQATQPEQRALMQKWHKEFSGYSTPGFRVLHTVSSCLMAIVTTSVFSFISLAIGRKLLRDLIRARTGTTLLALLVLDALFFIFVFAVALTIMMLISLPLAGIAGFFVAVLIRACWLVVGILIILLSVLLEFVFAPAWVKISALVATLPVVAVFVVALITFILFPIRGYVQKTATVLLDRTLQHEKGPIAFMMAIALLIETIIALAKG